MMSKEPLRRFGPERWVTLRETGEHVQVEAWSTITSAYRVRSRLRGVFLAREDEVEELVDHPESSRGRHWNRCPAARCGAPLTPNLPLCPRCNAPKCTCGRCACATTRTAAAKKSVKKVDKKTAAATRAALPHP